jgi:hypothetical protein
MQTASVDIELRRARDGLAGVVHVAHDPDALRRADLGADAARGAAILVRLFRVPEQHRDIAETLRQQAALFRVLDREQAFLRDRLIDDAPLSSSLMLPS